VVAGAGDEVEEGRSQAATMANEAAASPTAQICNVFMGNEPKSADVVPCQKWLLGRFLEGRHAIVMSCPTLGRGRIREGLRSRTAV
jgi:hypothetical protein